MTSNATDAFSISGHALPCRSPLSAVVWEPTLPGAFALQRARDSAGRVASRSTAAGVITSLGHDLERRRRVFDVGSCVAVPITVIGGRLGTDPTLPQR